jgi:phosphoribosylformylglycinamidine synthase subunit PurQ / glutaminase
VSLRVGVIVFPGSNGDHDSYNAAGAALGADARYVWHKEETLGDVDAVLVPGGFSYGDYLRAGAIARFSPVMSAVQAFAAQGGPVLGICNGFQILQEAGLVPGTMLRNANLRFLSQLVHVRVETTDSAATNGLAHGSLHAFPIAHGEGNFYAADDELDRLEANGQVVFRYVAVDGSAIEAGNPNGSARAIAGVCNAERNVVALMPHPERAAEAVLDSGNGRPVLEAFFRFAAARRSSLEVRSA